jgi:hypothetical protein
MNTTDHPITWSLVGSREGGSGPTILWGYVSSDVSALTLYHTDDSAALLRLVDGFFLTEVRGPRAATLVADDREGREISRTNVVGGFGIYPDGPQP